MSEDASEILWREYQMSVDLYKFYVDTVVKILVWYYAITGGILSFYFTKTALQFARWALLLPCAISVALAMLFFWGAARWEPIRHRVDELAEKLDVMNFELRVLQLLLRGAAILMIITAAVTCYVLAANPLMSPQQ